MKKQICAILSLAMLFGAFTGCNQTRPALPESPAPAAESASPDEGTRLADYALPDRFTGDWTGVEGCVNVHADAAISLPEADTVPTATVKRHFFTQADADKIREVFTGSSPFYEEIGSTKQSLQKLLNVYYDMQQGVIPIQLDGGSTQEVLERYIARTKAAIEEAPDESQRTAKDFLLRADTDRPEYENLHGRSEADGKIYHYYIGNTRNSAIGTNAIVYQEGYGDTNSCHAYALDDLPDSLPSVEPAITQTEAMSMADALLERLGLRDMVCGEIQGVNYYAYDSLQSYYPNGSTQTLFDAGYKMRYVRSVGGVPVIHTPNSGSASADGEADLPGWGYEQMEICVNGDGVVYFRWDQPYEQPEIETTAAELLPFGDIQDIFVKMIMVTNEDRLAINLKNGFEVHENMDVHDVTLRLMRVRDKYNGQEGRLIPVWDFWALNRSQAVDPSYSKYVYGDGYDEVVLTVNALDGTVIDRDFGY